MVYDCMCPCCSRAQLINVGHQITYEFNFLTTVGDRSISDFDASEFDIKLHVFFVTEDILCKTRLNVIRRNPLLESSEKWISNHAIYP